MGAIGSGIRLIRVRSSVLAIYERTITVTT